MNKQNAKKIKLETKLCISESGRCALCHRRNKRTAGTAETYLAGTDDWVCYDCARGIDPELAEFAYYPERYQKTRCADCYWGVCPECRRPYDRWFNVNREHWVVCLRHGFRWNVGSNLISGWKEEPESLHRANAEFLRRFREVEPWHPPYPTEPAELCVTEADVPF